MWSLGKALRVRRTGEVSLQTLVGLEGLRVNTFNNPHMVQPVTQRAYQHSLPCTTLIPLSKLLLTLMEMSGPKTLNNRFRYTLK